MLPSSEAQLSGGVRPLVGRLLAAPGCRVVATLSAPCGFVQPTSLPIASAVSPRFCSGRATSLRSTSPQLPRRRALSPILVACLASPSTAHRVKDMTATETKGGDNRGPSPPCRNPPERVEWPYWVTSAWTAKGPIAGREPVLKTAPRRTIFAVTQVTQGVFDHRTESAPIRSSNAGAAVGEMRHRRRPRCLTQGPPPPQSRWTLPPPSLRSGDGHLRRTPPGASSVAVGLAGAPLERPVLGVSSKVGIVHLADDVDQRTPALLLSWVLMGSSKLSVIVLPSRPAEGSAGPCSQLRRCPDGFFQVAVALYPSPTPTSETSRRGTDLQP